MADDDKIVTKKATTKKAAAKKAAIQKSATKKAVSKKSAAKKAVTKKAVTKKVAASKNIVTKNAPATTSRPMTRPASAVSTQTTAPTPQSVLPPGEAPSARKPVAVSPEQREAMIQEAAYYKAEKRNFAPGFEAQDWAEAEREVDEQLKKR